VGATCWGFVGLFRRDTVEVTLLLAGTKAKDYQANQKDIDIWSRQLQKQSFDNVRLRYE